MPTQIAQFRDCDMQNTEHNSDLTAMMDVVGHDAPDGPLARDRVGLSLVGLPVGLRQIINRPTGERFLDHLPCHIQPPDQFGGISYNSLLRLPVFGLSGKLRAARSIHTLEPTYTSEADVTGDLAYRA